MKVAFRIAVFLLLPIFACSQQTFRDSMQIVLRNAITDSAVYEAERDLYNYFEEVNRDSALYYAQESLLIARKNNKKLAEVRSLCTMGYQLMHLGRYATSLECLLQAFKIAEDPKNDKEETWRLALVPSPGKTRLLMLALTHHMFALLMEQTQNVEQQIVHFRAARTISIEIGNQYRLLLANSNLGNSYQTINKLDSALFYAKEGERISIETGLKKFQGYIFSALGDIHLKKGDKELARKYFYAGLKVATEQKTMSSVSINNARIINYYRTENEKDSLLKYALNNIRVVRSMGAVIGSQGTGNNMGSAYEYLSIGYKMNNQFDSAFKYQSLAIVTKDSLFKVRMKNLAEFQNLSINEQRRLQSIEQEKLSYQNKIRTYALVAGLGIFLLIALILYRNNYQKQKTNKKLQRTLENLKTTQAQLVQSEKMASLGELTAGIAHEIQNPLNFVNNFSEVNKELLVEMRGEITKGNYDEVNTLAKDIEDNEEKINHHGKRADAIVKGMLQHSRSSSGTKEPTDINALADEYLRLAYHGLRAKEKSFNATLKTDYDQNIGTINIISQDLGRALLNLITNAFYAVDEKKKQQPTGYEPTVWVSTKKLNGAVEISVKDNGNGIPQKVLDKIFQPFFTTKPTGKGTGLGLSLTYDIVKAHGGDLKAKTKEGQDAEFIITLPL